MKTHLPLLFLALATGCGAEKACEDYFDAYESCVNELLAADTGAAMSFDLSDSYCSEADGAKDEFQCMADAYNSADCTTVDGVTEANTKILSCVSP